MQAGGKVLSASKLMIPSRWAQQRRTAVQLRAGPACGHLSQSNRWQQDGYERTAQQFMADSPWDEIELWRVIAEKWCIQPDCGRIVDETGCQTG